jgi:uncharacterized OsmC-like protein
MADQAKLRKVFERKLAAFTKRPSAAKLTRGVTVRTDGGTTCEIEGDGWKFTADQPEIQGGNGEGPDPEFFASAALGACMAQVYARVFANKGVTLAAVEVRVEADLDLRGSFGVSKDVPVGFQEMRYFVEIDSDASENEILNALKTAEKCSPLFSTFANPLKITRQVSIRQPQQAAASKA